MDVTEAIRSRRSIRSYRPDPVPEELVREILEEARWAPSWRNTQSWHVWVLTGAALESFRATLTEKLVSGEPGTPDVEGPGDDIPAACSRRIQQLTDERYACESAAGMDCSPEAGSRRLGGLFGAPCLLVVGFEDCLAAPYACFDAGSLSLNICLAAEARGLSTCVMATAVRFADVLRGLLPDSAGKRLVIGILLGYGDRDAPINAFTRQRAELDEFVRFVG